ncbi:MAG TPA: flagellar hook capping FlgD N-terminal domain-containing protein [Bryobacteraceae bacterium]|jgi:flagellar basal-body rod modification protein FlgD|nr:flagellar hook capping FlgD N-terminal domain-containing protein [Bryobacteraceae bacterium]
MVISGTTPTSSADLSSAAASTSSTTASSNNPNNLASEQTFLQLFVAQLQNQDPLNPNEQDPTQMVSELAQFSELEQLVNIGQNVQSIDQAVAPSSAASTSSSTDNSNTGSTNSSQGA